MQHKKLPSAAAAAAAHHRRHQCIMKSSRKAEKQKSSNASILHFNAASWWHKFSHPVYLGIFELCSKFSDRDEDGDAFMYMCTAMGHLHFRCPHAASVCVMCKGDATICIHLVD